MATSLAMDHPSLASQDTPQDTQDMDPFSTGSSGSNHHRFSNFDTKLFALSPATSPEQAKRALEAHLKETEKRIESASKLGNDLVEQRKALEERLVEVQKQQSESELSPELRQKLSDIEKEYNEVGRESARAFLPKSRVSSAEMGGSPFASDKRSLSPSKFESQATNSPSKLSVPSRKQRNTPSNRVHDIEFATEISTSLLSQVRHLQQLLSEKEDALKTVTLEKSKLEVEAEGFSQRLRSLDESENRYKDENWNLETQIHEYMAAAKEAAEREKKLNQSLNLAHSEKSAAQKELDEIKLTHAKLTEEHLATVKHHDVEMGSAKRAITMGESERGALQRRIEELAGQNTELAKAFAHQRGRQEELEPVRQLSDEDFATGNDSNTPEHSPPPSPVKGTPRHSLLESETLKSSLHHAHRMIQQLKGNIHKEKTEKLELKRMLQEARDDLDAKRSEARLSTAVKRSRKVESRDFKKPVRPAALGAARNSRSDILILDDPNWEDETGQPSPTRGRAPAHSVAGIPSSLQDITDTFETANETSDAAFETANERGTETEDFQTGQEDMSGTDELTETEERPKSSSTRSNPLSLHKPGTRLSYQSTASTSADEDDDYDEIKTPTADKYPRLKSRSSRLSSRRSRAGSEDPSIRGSPAASLANSSRHGTPSAAGQSLFAELGDMSDDDYSTVGGRSAFASPTGTPGPSRPSSRPSTAKNTPAHTSFIPPVPKLPMVDSSMMTESWEPEPAPSTPKVDSSMMTEPEETRPPTPNTAVPILEGAAAGTVGGLLAGASMSELMDKMRENRSSTGTQVEIETSDAGSQWHRELPKDASLQTEGTFRPVSDYSDMSSQYDDPTGMEEKLSSFPSPPVSRADSPLVSRSEVKPAPAPLTISTIHSEHVEPIEPVEVEPPVAAPVVAPIIPEVAPAPPTPVKHVPAPLVFSSLQFVDTEPIEAVSPRTPKRNAVIIPRDASDNDISYKALETNDRPESSTPKAVEKNEKPEPSAPRRSLLGSVFGYKSKTPTAPIIAEDETRQSPSASPSAETPESQRPFKELSSNTNEISPKKVHVETKDESCQTSLTATQIDEMLRLERKTSVILQDGPKSPTSPTRALQSALKSRKSQDSIVSSGRLYDVTGVAPKRPTSATSSRHGSISSTHPPLPANSKKVIAAAAQRTGSSQGPPGVLVTCSGQANESSVGSPVIGSMGPPFFPASATRNGSMRPRTPSSQPPMSPSLKDGTTPRPVHSSGGPQSPTGTGARSRRSSVSSFASELETRFNIRGMPMPQGVDTNTDPRMINAITQTMIGEYLWKYTRKAGRGAFSENRHRRYFWVHPYTRTLYWSDRDPSREAGRAELKAKSVPIEAVRVVTDDNPMPPGLHRKSLIIMTPGRAVKFTATTGQRHETWFNALSYLLLRTGEDAVNDTHNLANDSLSRDDIAEFNPGFGNSASRQGPASLSSYNSRTTRNESQSGRTSRNAATHTGGSRPTIGTLSRLSGYMVGSAKSRQSLGNGTSIYDASEVHDSAEDLREMIEQQDRESDKLENVRACCDGKHDVGHLHTGSQKGRQSGQAQTLGASTLGLISAPRAKSRTSVMRRTD
ncbi:hypothetical protein HYALB_00005655 [Hymenoscyphus albidus]|uniref:PH domain-containing protein n=1 Tax=Hymenoscyphus albidus TaxID=595503 RepID=A0A9N9LLJ6_9HELO|nr:hypothetical protein HYALB_00005655 [Hymenoscyphus albidus]